MQLVFSWVLNETFKCIPDFMHIKLELEICFKSI